MAEKRSMETTPSAADITRFLQCWDILGRFEAEHQHVRKWGAFDDREWPEKPDPAVVRVVEWLKGMQHA